MTAGFLLDTNVLSELMREQPAPQVLNWFALQTPSQLFTSVITHAEILTGIALLPFSKRQQAIAQAADQMFAQDFDGRCLVFGGQSVGHYAMVRAHRQLAGRPIDTADAQIAAIALAAGLKLATRNTKDFEGIERLDVVNPWLGH